MRKKICESNDSNDGYNHNTRMKIHSRYLEWIFSSLCEKIYVYKCTLKLNDSYNNVMQSSL